jgi:hypothetical protein
VLHIRLPLNQDGSTSREIDRFLASLRTDPVLHRDFTTVELADIRQAGGGRGSGPETTFSILCSSKGARAAASAPSREEAGEPGNRGPEGGNRAQALERERAKRRPRKKAPSPGRPSQTKADAAAGNGRRPGQPEPAPAAAPTEHS